METFEQLPIHLDSQTKALSAPSAQTNLLLQNELTALNLLHRAIQQSDNPAGVPPPPVPVNPKRSAQITKMREAGNASFRKGDYAGALKLYTLGLEMAQGRPLWEPSGLVREELSTIYANRAQCQMALNSWPEGALDAQCSVELKKVGNAKAWWRRGRCLFEMGRLDEALEWTSEAVDFEGQEEELVQLLGEIRKAVEARK